MVAANLHAELLRRVVVDQTAKARECAQAAAATHGERGGGAALAAAAGGGGVSLTCDGQHTGLFEFQPSLAIVRRIPQALFEAVTAIAGRPAIPVGGGPEDAPRSALEIVVLQEARPAQNPLTLCFASRSVRRAHLTPSLHPGSLLSLR